MAARAVTFLRGVGPALLFALLLGGCAKKADPTDAAKRFFALLAAGDVAGAYAVSAFGFQAQQTQTAFANNVTQLALTQQTDAAWEPPEITDDEAKVRVEITTAEGSKLPFVVTLVNQSGAWRVHSLRFSRGPGQPTANRFSLVGKGAAFSDVQSQPLPREEEILKLAQRTMRDFDEAVREKSFEKFYDTVAVAWRKQLTVAQLERAFAPFINAEVKIGGIGQAEMQLDGPPSINPEGVLVVNGHFNTAPYQIYFSMKFVHEQPWWKLFGLDVRLQK
jgi:hypothetical protein